ncbi:MAG: hypothetical protein IT290_07295 [Deltaproteobacteria bacterium]|nr:hypothetical protein [Deltaproteobacteria bacterium]
MPWKALFGGLSVAVEIATIFPYILKTIRGVVRPHSFSWLIWAISLAVNAAAQIVSGAGAGSWLMTWCSFTCLVVFGLSLRYSEIRWTRTDYGFLAAALLATLAWPIVDDPLPSVLLLTAIDLLGYGPTLRKVWHRPDEEDLTFWCFVVVKFALSIAALEHYSLTTWLYPFTCGVVINVVLVSMIVFRRRALGLS